MKISELNKSEYNTFYQTYISKVQSDSLLDCLQSNKESTLKLLSGLPDEKFNYAYQEGKWTIKELVQHIIDTERIFAVRALRIARNDKTPQPGFDQDEFNLTDEANSKSKDELIADYLACKNNSIALINSFTTEMLKRLGTVSGFDLTARAACFIIVGHEAHHIQILKERYL